MVQVATDVSQIPATAPVERQRSRHRVILRFLIDDKIGFAGFVIFGFFVLLALFGPILLPSDKVDVTAIYAPPSWDHPLGTDSSGHDVLIQVVRGARSVLAVGALAAVISTAIAVSVGALAALAGGWPDSVILTITDVVLTVPYIVLLGVLAAYVQLDSPYLLALVIASVAWPTLLRAVRAQVLSLKER